MAQTVETVEVFQRDEKGDLTPQGEAARWTMEFLAARQAVQKWHRRADKIIDRYLDERDRDSQGESRLNLFTANVDSQHSMLYGKVPTADVARVFEDQNDDVARVASEMWERLLKPKGTNDTYCTALGYALEDRLLPGLGFATARYEVETEPATEELTGEAIEDENGEPVERKSFENVEVDYHHWKDVLWSPARTFEEWRWGAWKAQMTRRDLIKRFGEDVGNEVPMSSKTGRKGDSDAARNDPWSRADVWEIWSKEDRKVYWYVEGYSKVLDVREDPYGLEGFFPFPKPMIARPTTRNFIPQPDFLIAQDLYNEIDKLTTRINLLEDAVRIAGAYDKSAPEVAKLLSEAGFNKLYPADNWAALAEKGGFKGVVDWFPLEQVVAAIGVLTEKRAEKIQLLQQVTGWADIMRGQSNPNETLGAQKLKAGYGSIRIERYKAEFARFATDLQRIRAEIIAKHFDAATIIERSNVLNTPDADKAQAAADLIKSGANAFRIEVKPENINLTDYAQLKSERAEVITALGGLVSAFAPLVQNNPQAQDLLLAMGQWVLAGVKGGDSLEAEFDNFRSKVQQAAQQAAMQPPPKDPKVQAAEIDLQTKQMEAGAKREEVTMDMQAKRAEHAMDMQKMQADTVKRQIDARTEVAKAQAMPQQPMPMPMEGRP